jgi:hypothetical protein
MSSVVGYFAIRVGHGPRDDTVRFYLIPADKNKPGVQRAWESNGMAMEMMGKKNGAREVADSKAKTEKKGGNLGRSHTGLCLVMSDRPGFCIERRTVANMGQSQPHKDLSFQWRLQVKSIGMNTFTSPPLLHV